MKGPTSEHKPTLSVWLIWTSLAQDIASASALSVCDLPLVHVKKEALVGEKIWAQRYCFPNSSRGYRCFNYHKNIDSTWNVSMEPLFGPCATSFNKSEAKRVQVGCWPSLFPGFLQLLEYFPLVCFQVGQEWSSEQLRCHEITTFLQCEESYCMYKRNFRAQLQ